MDYAGGASFLNVRVVFTKSIQHLVAEKVAEKAGRLRENLLE